VEIGARYNVPIRVLSSFKDNNGDGGTLITRKDATMEGLTLTGLACEGGYARLAFRGLPQEMRVTSDILTRLAAAQISVDMLAQVDSANGRRQLQLTIPEDALKEGHLLCETMLQEHGGETLDVTRGLTRVALVGSGMYGLPGVYARTYRALQEADIEVHDVSSSSISISLLVDSKDEERSLQVLHDAFDLGEGGE
jgi:aspartate kinase